MKKQLFTFVMMIALVIVAGSAMGQGSATSPQLGSTQTYTVGGLDAGDVWTFVVTASTDDLQNASSTLAGTEFNFVGANTGTVPATPVAATADIKWLAAGSYRVWIKVTDEGASGCSNYRFVGVTVVDNNFNVSIIALGTGDDKVTDISARMEDVIDCPKFVSENFLNGSGAEGSTYAYFKVTRTVDAVPSADWSFTPAIGGSATATKWESSSDGITWSTVTTIESKFSVISVASKSQSVWFRATVTNVTEASKTLIFNYGSTAKESTNNADQDDSGLNTATLTISPLPKIGTFTGL